jgi:hypothetical protein
MENNETTSEAAARETLEEAGANIEMQALYSMLNVPHVHQVHLFYRARLLDLNFSAGTESLEVKLFSEADIPWEDLAFPTVSKTLTLFFADLAAHKNPQSFGFHSFDIRKSITDASALAAALRSMDEKSRIYKSVDGHVDALCTYLLESA